MIVFYISGTTSIPINRPVCAFHNSQNGGKICVLGSCHIFSDQYMDKEENGKLFDVIIDYLTSEKVSHPDLMVQYLICNQLIRSS